MGLSVTIQVETARVLRPREFMKALTSSMRKAGTTALRDMKSEAKKAVRGKKLLKVRAIGKAISTERSGTGRIETMRFALVVGSKPVRVSDYRHRQTKTGISVRINPGKLTKIRSAFKASMPSGRTGVFKRRGNARRLPIDEQFASRVIDALSPEPSQRRVQKRGAKTMVETTKRILPIELEKLIK